MKIFWTIFRKEIVDNFRDRRTIIMLVLVPLLLFPVLMTVMARVMVSQRAKAEEKVLQIVLVANSQAEAFRQGLLQRKDMTVLGGVKADSIEPLIQSERVDAAIVFSLDFDEKVRSMQHGTVMLYHKSVERSDITRRRMLDLLGQFEKQLLRQRFQSLHLQEKIIEAVEVQEQDVASLRERIGRAIGGFLPYIFIIFSFMAVMYTAIDLGAAEKERGTIETLLTAPVSRRQILFGKFAVVVVMGVATAGISIIGLALGMYTAISQAVSIPPAILSMIWKILEPTSVLLLLSLLIPLTIFFGGVLLSLSIFARSFKEAQSIMSPLMILVIVPAVIGLIPGIKLDVVTALIPILNISLATKEILAGGAQMWLLVEVFASLILLAMLSISLSSWSFNREETIFRGS